jgi:hypothetical protein
MGVAVKALVVRPSKDDESELDRGGEVDVTAIPLLVPVPGRLMVAFEYLMTVSVTVYILVTIWSFFTTLVLRSVVC